MTTPDPLTAEITEWATAQADAAPPLTQDQIADLRRVFQAAAEKPTRKTA